MIIEEIAADWYRLEIPLAGRMSTNTYVIKGPERNLLIDPGNNDEECKTAMLSALNQLDIDLEQTDFFITHAHGDHYGLLPQLICEGSVIYASRTDAMVINRNRADTAASDLRHFLEACGFPPIDPEKLQPPAMKQNRIHEPLNFTFVEDGEEIRIGKYRFVCVETPGHSEGHMCLYEPDLKYLISGDHILGSSSPAIAYKFNHFNPMGSYLESLDKVGKLDVLKVLPGHRNVFGDCRKKIAAFKAVIENRCEEIVSILQDGGQTTYQTASRMKWNVGGADWDSLPVFQHYLAAEKTAAYLRYLEEKGVLKVQIRNDEWMYSHA